MASNAFELAATAAKIHTIADVRAAMGAVTLTLSKAYARLDEISTIAGENKAARDLLDTVNKSANLLYHKYGEDPELFDQEISTWNAHLAGQVIAQANDALKTVEAAANEDIWNIASIVDEGLGNAGKWTGMGVQGVTNALSSGLSAFVSAAWPTLVIIGGVAVLYFYRDRVFAALKRT